MAATEWATMDTVEWGLKDLHVKGTRRRGGVAIDFWMFNPDIPQDAKPCRIRCGICKRGMDGFQSCPNCYPWRNDDGEH